MIKKGNYKEGDELPKSKYVGVFAAKASNGTLVHWSAQITHNRKVSRKFFNADEERKAALWYDKKRIEFGLEPVNILKRKI